MKKKLTIGIVILIVLVSFVGFSGNASAKRINLVVDDDGTVGVNCDYNTIQAAVDAANPGDTIRVKPGMYVESVTITTSIKLRGKDATIKCPTTPEDVYLAESSKKYQYLVGIFGGTYDATTDTYSGAGTISVELSGFTLDANDFSPSNRWSTVLLRNANNENGKTKVKKCVLINANVNGKETFGILGYGTMKIEVNDNVVNQFSRGGIGMYSGVSNIEKNVIIGPGLGVPVTWAPNGIQLGYGASGKVKSNEVRGCGWPGTAWAGSGIIIVDTSNVKVEKNWVHHCEQAIAVVDFPASVYGSVWDGVVSDIYVKNNIIEDNEYGIAVANDCNNIKVENNKVHNNNYDGITVYDYTVYHPGATINPPTNVIVTKNSIVGNGQGLWVGPSVTQTVNAEKNWWGHKSGPSGDGPGSGDSVFGNADYEPWIKRHGRIRHGRIRYGRIRHPRHFYIGKC